MKTAGKLFLFMSILVVATVVAPSAVAEDDNYLVRTRLLFIQPNDDSDGTLETLLTEVDSDVTVEVDLTRFFGEHWAVEAILATAAQEVSIDDGSGRTSLGSVYHAPATILGQYHLNPGGNIDTYFGAGINYTIFYDESGELHNTFDLDSTSAGPAAQFGMDFALGEGKVFNFDLKYILIETDVAPQGGASLGTVEVDPLVVGFGFGFRF